MRDSHSNLPSDLKIWHLSVRPSLHEDLLDHEVAELGESEDLLEDLGVAVGATQPRQRELDLAERLRHAHEVALVGVGLDVVVFVGLNEKLTVETRWKIQKMDHRQK